MNYRKIAKFLGMEMEKFEYGINLFQIEYIKSLLVNLLIYRPGLVD